ncbi:MAG: UV DNA damage repair endonuclease UvsE [Velocimicrobium sp.]
MKIGYACKTVGVPNTTFQSCKKNTAGEENLTRIIAYNLNVLERMLDYNVENGITMFRISSDLIPFASSPINSLPWWEIYQETFLAIGKKIKDNGIRVSMHPGQYTVLNSPYEDVVQRAVKDLEYHCRALDQFMLSKEHKIILHIGGAYHDKELAKQRFVKNYMKLDQSIKDRIILENDDKLFDIKDVLEIASQVMAPVVFDTLHHELNCCENNKDPFFWINECKKTWKSGDGDQKIHYSEQHPRKRKGSHSDTISAEVFYDFYEKLKREDIDIMLEVKDKNLSAIKALNVVRKRAHIKFLEQEWSRYKYLVLEHSHSDYEEIRQLLRNKAEYPVLSFYEKIDHALLKEITRGNGENAARHIWGYFKELATKEEKEQVERRIKRYKSGNLSVLSVKKYLWKLTLKYREDYLIQAYYFNECNQKM